VWLYAAAQLDETLHYKPEGRGFDSRWGFRFFHWFNPSGRAMFLGSTNSVNEMSIKDLPLGGTSGRFLRLTTLSAWKSWQPQPPGVLRAYLGLHRDSFACTSYPLNTHSSIEIPIHQSPSIHNTRWFKYDRDDLCVNKSQFVPIIFEPPCTIIWIFNVLEICYFERLSSSYPHMKT
jgi:hypothetical protein